MVVLFIFAAVIFYQSKSRGKLKYKKGGSILSTLSNIGTFIYIVVQSFVQLIQIFIFSIQFLIKSFTPVIKLLFKDNNKLYLLTQKKTESQVQSPKVSIPSNVISFAKYQKSSIS